MGINTEEHTQRHMSVTIREKSFRSTSADFPKCLDVIRRLRELRGSWTDPQTLSESVRQGFMADRKWYGGL